MTAQTSPSPFPKVMPQQTTPEVEDVSIALLSWMGAEHKWTWALYRTGNKGRELYTEIPQKPDPAYADEQAVLSDLLKLFPEHEYMLGYGSQMAFWPSVKCRFERVPHGKGTRLKLVSFKLEEHDRAHEVERLEQTLRLRLRHYTFTHGIEATLPAIHRLVADNPDKTFEELIQLLGGNVTTPDTMTAKDILDAAFPRDENSKPIDELTGQPDTTPTPAAEDASDTDASKVRVPLAGRVDSRSKALHHIPKHIGKWLKITDSGELGKTILTIFGKPLPDLFPLQPDLMAESAGEQEKRVANERLIAERLARQVDVYVDNALKAMAEAPQQPVSHWSADPAFLAELDKLKSQRKETAIMKSGEWGHLYLTILGVGSFGSWTGDRESALAKLREGLVERYKQNGQTVNTDTNENQTNILPGQIHDAKLKVLFLFDQYGIEATAENFIRATGYVDVQSYLNDSHTVGQLLTAIRSSLNESAKNVTEADSSEPSASPVPDVPQTPEKSIAANSNGQGSKPLEKPTKMIVEHQSLTVVPNTGLATLPMVAQWEIMRQQADVLIKSGFLPQSVKTPEQAITIMMMGNALSIEPIVALNSINVIQGKPTVSPQLMLALVRRSGQLESMKVTDDGETCTVEMTRRNEPTHVEKFSRKDADAMGLSGKDNWKKQPATMRRWRAIAAACRVVFPDCIWGIASYTTEEIDPDTIVIDAA